MTASSVIGRTNKDFTGSGSSSMTNGGNYSDGQTPTGADDVTLTSSTPTVRIANGDLSIGSLNVTNASSYTISNNTGSSTSRTLTLGGGDGIDSVAGSNSGDLIYLGSATTLTIQGPNSGSGSGALNLALAASGRFDVTQSGGSLAISAVISGSGFGITKTGAGSATFSGANTYTGGTTLTAGTLQLSGSGTLGATNGALTVNGGTLNLNGASEGVGSFTGSGGTILNNATGTNVTLTIGNSNGTGGSFQGVIADHTSGTGTIALTKTGTGTITLSGSNTYTGATTISAGVLNIQNATALGATTSGTTVASGATLQLQNGITVGAEALTISGAGASGQNGALVNVSGTNNYGGLLTLGAATTISSDSGTLNLTNSGAITGATFGLTLTGSGGGSVSSIIGTTSGTLTKSGTGTWTLTGADTYTGATTISAGVLNIQNATALGTTAAGTTVSSGAALQIQNGIAVGAEALTLNGSGISSDGALRNITGTNSWSGAITLASVSTIGSDAGTLTLSSTINNGGSMLTTTGAGSITLSGIISGSGGLSKNGSGTLTLGGLNTYSGGTTVNAGTLQMSVVNQLLSTGAVTVVGGTLDLQTFNQTIGTLTLNGGSITGTGILTSSSFGLQSGTVSSIIGGAGGLTKTTSGTLTLSGVNTYTGATAISAGTLQINTNGALGTTLNGTTVSSGAALKLNAVNYSTAEALTLNGSGISGAGALTNSGTSTFAGAINIATNATISPGGGTLNLTGGVSKNGTTLTFAGGGTVHIMTNGITGSSPNSDLVVDGTTVVLDTPNSYNGPTTVQNSGTLKLGASNVLPSSPQTAMTVNTSSIFDLASYSDGVASLAGDSTATVKNSAASTTSTLTVNPSSGSTTFAGVIAGTNAGAQGDLALVKSGAGTFVLTGVNTYTGATTINAGTLDVNGSLASGSAVTVNNSGSVLGGIGTIYGSVSIASNGAILEAGTGSTGQTLTMRGAVSLASGSVIELALGASGAHSTLAIGSGGSIVFQSLQKFNIIDLGVTDGSTYTGLITGIGANPGTESGWTIPNQAWAYNFSYAAANGGEIDLSVTAVPEPSTYLVGALALAALAYNHRRRILRMRGQ